MLILAAIYYLQRPEPIRLRFYRVASGQVKETVSNTRVGTVKACRRAYLAPGAGGEVTRLDVHEGDIVQKNQVLLEVWNKGLQARLDLDKAQIKSDRARTEQSCQTAAGSYRVAQRLSKLKHQGQIVSDEAVDLARTKARAQQAACRAAKQQVIVDQARLQVTRAAIEQTRIRAPFKGVIAEVNAELGEYITPSPPGIPTLPAIDLIDTSCLYISAPIDEVDAPRIRNNLSVCVSLDAFPEPRCSGKITRIAPYVLEKEKQARTVEVEVKLADRSQLDGLLPGYSADIEILIAQKPHTLRIPTEAILEGNKVLVRQADGLLVERIIKTGLQNWNFTEVLSGLEAGEDIVLSVGREGVKAGIYTIKE